jgi:hypothetical protein
MDSFEKQKYIYSIINKWACNVHIDLKSKTHNLGFQKEKLKALLCNCDPLTGEKNV